MNISFDYRDIKFSFWKTNHNLILYFGYSLIIKMNFIDLKLSVS
jgi:hypothetical protein